MVDWLQISQASGSGDSQILVRATENPSYFGRNSSLDVSGNTKSVSIPVYQYGVPFRHFTILIHSGGKVNWTNNYSYTRLSYSINGGNWSEPVSAGSVTLVAGEAISFRGNNLTCSGLSFNATAQISLHGNIMSLVDSVGFDTNTTIPSNSCFYSLFQNSSAVTYADELELPATTLTPYCYSYMFALCRNLLTVPELPATTMAEGCYNLMFQGCPSLTTPPELPATNLAIACYRGMFSDSSGLTTAPVLSATVLADECYSNMFFGCKSLTVAPTLPATTLTQSCYQNMFTRCIGITTMPELPATTLANGCYKQMFSECTNLKNVSTLPATALTYQCYQGMFSGCTSLTMAPELPATTLAGSCYYSMFQDCTSLTTAPELPATTLASSCYYSMFYGCSALTRAPVLSASTLVDGCYYNMFYNCGSLSYIECYATDISASNCTRYWVRYVSQLGTFVKAASMSSWGTGPNGIPAYWTVINA